MLFIVSSSSEKILLMKLEFQVSTHHGQQVVWPWPMGRITWVGQSPLSLPPISLRTGWKWWNLGCLFCCIPSFVLMENFKYSISLTHTNLEVIYSISMLWVVFLKIPICILDRPNSNLISIFFFFFFCFSGPQLLYMEFPRGQIGAAASGLCHCQILTYWAGSGIEPESSWILVRFGTHWATTGTPLISIFSPLTGNKKILKYLNCIPP